MTNEIKIAIIAARAVVAACENAFRNSLAEVRALAYRQPFDHSPIGETPNNPALTGAEYKHHANGIKLREAKKSLADLQDKNNKETQ